MRICHRACFFALFRDFSNIILVQKLLTYVLIEVYVQTMVFVDKPKIIWDLDNYHCWVNTIFVFLNIFFLHLFFVAIIKSSLPGLVICIIFKYLEMIFFICKFVAFFFPHESQKPQKWMNSDTVLIVYSSAIFVGTVVITVYLRIFLKEIPCLIDVEVEMIGEPIERETGPTVPDRPLIRDDCRQSWNTDTDSSGYEWENEQWMKTTSF